MKLFYHSAAREVDLRKSSRELIEVNEIRPGIVGSEPGTDVPLGRLCLGLGEGSV